MTKLEITAKLMASEIATLAPEKLQEYISDNLKEFAADAVNSLSFHTEAPDKKVLIEYGLLFSFKKLQFVYSPNKTTLNDNRDQERENAQDKKD